MSGGDFTSGFPTVIAIFAALMIMFGMVVGVAISFICG